MARILIVDDSGIDRRLVAGLLKAHVGWEIQEVPSATDAIQAIRQECPHLVITDLAMPGMSGLELVTTLRQEFPQLPVVIMTGVGTDETAMQSLKSGAASYVPKSRLANYLVEVVQGVLDAAHEGYTRERLTHRISAKRIEFYIENDTELIAALVQYLQEETQQSGVCNEADRIRVGVALQEALTNACYHGNLEVSSELREVNYRDFYDLARERMSLFPYCERRIRVAAEYSQECALFEIEDEGPGFDPLVIPNPTDARNLEKPSGRGLLLMQMFMDEVKYEKKGNLVILKKLRREQVEGS